MGVHGYFRLAVPQEFYATNVKIIHRCVLCELRVGGLMFVDGVAVRCHAILAMTGFASAS